MAVPERYSDAARLWTVLDDGNPRRGCVVAGCWTELKVRETEVGERRQRCGFGGEAKRHDGDEGGGARRCCGGDNEGEELRRRRRCCVESAVDLGIHS